MTFYKKKIIYREDHKPYLIRRTLFSCAWFSIKLHNILLSDYECLHDHPWAFVSILLKGWYIEHSEKGCRYYGAGSMLRRKAEFCHRLEVHEPVWSLVITFKRMREWGFVTKRGWVHWKKYVPENTCE